MRTSKKIAIVGLVSTCSLGMAGAALAFGATSPDNGSQGWNGGATVYNKDLKGDGHPTYTRWNYLSYPRLDNYEGSGHTIYTTPSNQPITAIKACTNYAGVPDNCSGWDST